MQTRTALVAGLVVACLVPSGATARTRNGNPIEECGVDIMLASAKIVKKLAACQMKAASSGLPPDSACFAGPPITPCAGTDSVGVDQRIEAFIRDLVTSLRPSNMRSKCASRKLRMARNYAAKLLPFRSQLESRPFGKLIGLIAHSEDRFYTGFARAEASRDCLTTGDEQAIVSKVDNFVSQVLALTNSGFADQVFVQHVISEPTVPTPVSLIGALRFSRQGQFMGAVGMRFGNGGLAILDARAGQPLQIVVGNSIVGLSGPNPGDLVVDGAVIDVSTAFALYQDDWSGTTDPSAWSPSSQALLALSALVSTDVWNLNLAAMIARYGGGTTQASGSMARYNSQSRRSRSLLSAQSAITPRSSPLDPIQDFCNEVNVPPFCSPLPLPIPNPCNPPGPIPSPLDCEGWIDDALDLDPIDACSWWSDCEETFCDIATSGLVSALSFAAGPQGGQLACQAVCVTLVASPLPVVDEALCVATCLSIGTAATVAHYVGEGCTDPPPSPNPSPPMYCATGECGCFAPDRPYLCHSFQDECCQFFTSDEFLEGSPLCDYTTVGGYSPSCHTHAECVPGVGQVCGWGSGGFNGCGLDAPPGCWTVDYFYTFGCCCPAPSSQVCLQFALRSFD